MYAYMHGCTLDGRDAKDIHTRIRRGEIMLAGGLHVGFN